MRSLLVRALAALAFFVLASSLRAQSIGYEVPRIYGPGARVQGDGEPFSHRYNYGVSPQFYFNGDARQMWYQDYLDRLDRAERFGYCPPSGPRYWPAPPCRPRIFGGVGIFAK